MTYDDSAGDDMADVTPEEARAIASLKRLAAKWPRSLTLASMGGSLVVVHTNDERFDSAGTVERETAVLADIHGIPNTGGDW